MAKKYQQLYHTLLRDIENGVYNSGDKLPTESELSQMGYSRNTVRQALSMLQADGLILKKRGSGSIVKPSLANRDLSGNIALVFNDFNRYIFSDTLSGINDAMRNWGTPLLYATKGKYEEEERILRELAHKDIDGIIVQGFSTGLPNPNTQAYQELIDSGIPVVFLFSRLPRLTGAGYVGNDDKEGGRQAVQQLLDRGCKSIGGLFVYEFLQSHLRFEGFAEMCRRNEIVLNSDHILWLPEGFSKSPTFPLPSLFEKLTKVDGLVCCNDYLAKAVIEYMADRGLRIPDDISVISFDNSFVCEYSSTAISSFDGQPYEIGYQGATLMKEILSGASPSEILLPWTFVKRKSC